MSTATVRISEKARHTLGELAANMGKPMQAVLDMAIEDYRRRCFLETANEAYAALRRDPKAWRAELDERRAWDATSADDLEDK